MKNNYDKYITEVFELKESAQLDYRNSGYKKFSDFLEKELEKIDTKPYYYSSNTENIISQTEKLSKI